MARQFIYQMQGLTKRLGTGRELLQNIWLSFYPGAKIGIIGANGSGKSTLLKIMAGIDKDIEGTVWRDPDARVGYLPQEPQLDPTLDVRGNVMLGVARQRKILDDFEVVCARFGEELTDDEMNDLIEKQATLQDQIDAEDLWELDRKIEIAMDALRVPNPDADVTTLSGGLSLIHI